MTQAFTEITQYDAYNERMAKSMLDKLFFLDKVDAQLYVDFGCADGTLFKFMRPFAKDAVLVGYDIDPKMCDAARANTGDYYTDKWDIIAANVKAAKDKGERTAIILNSVIHEVYNYCDPRQIDKFWKDVFGAGFDFIIIRDMIPSETVDRPSDINDVSKVWRKFRHHKALRDFEGRWGGIESNKNLLHWFLKYQYLEPNWEREVKENYIPLYHEDLLSMPPDNYNIMYHEHYVLPHLKRLVKKDFGIELKDATHLKIILEA